MKNQILILLALLVPFLMSAQNFEGIIKFENKITYKNEKDSIKHTESNKLLNERFGSSPSDYVAYDAETYLKNDSCLIVKYYFQPDTPDFYVLNIRDKAFYINLKSGKQNEYQYYFKKLHPPYKFKKKVKIIEGYDCVLYKAEDEKIRSEIWVATKLNVDTSQKAFSHFMHKGKVIMEQTHYAKLLKITKQTRATYIKELKINKIFARVKEYTKLDDSKKMYPELKENAKINIPPIKVGDELPALYYRDVKNFNIKSLNIFKGNGKYLMLEFWGTWCAPCLRATPKIKEFYIENKDKLDLLSVNWGDRMYKRVLEMIEKKEMNWNHAFGTKKLINILNPPKKYPTMVLLDDNLKVLFIGNPGVHLKKAAKLIK